MEASYDKQYKQSDTHDKMWCQQKRKGTPSFSCYSTGVGRCGIEA